MNVLLSNVHLFEWLCNYVSYPDFMLEAPCITFVIEISR